MKWGLRWGDPWGRTADGSTGGLLTISTFESLAAARTWRIAWTWTGGGQRWGYRWGRRWGRTPVWFKVYVAGKLRQTTRDTSLTLTLEDSEDPVVAVVVVGPGNSDPVYDPAIAIEAVPGNRVKLTWTPPTNSDLDHFHIYTDAGDGSVDYSAPVAEVEADGSASYQWISGPLADGTYKYVVRAVDSAGNEETNTTVASVAIATWPTAPTKLAYVFDPVTDTVRLTWTGGATVNVYSNGGSGGAIDYSSAVASSVTSPWTSSALLANKTYRFGVRADNGSYEEKNLEYVEFELDGSTNEINRPNSPFALEVTPAAGGTFTVTGRYDPRRAVVKGRTPPAVSAVRIYHDNGTGTMDWITQLGTATLTLGANGIYYFRYTTAAYGHGTTVTFGARAVTSGGTTDSNLLTDSAVADATAPSPPTALAGSAVRDTRGDR